ncbi:MAG: hypothetical protein VXW99_08180, partial [Pseudomonadota bacterium]|nr:hypothetical protein [Pseudomonadota bacterium]
HTAGTLPTGITLTDNGDNTATLSGTAPIVTSDTTFNFTLTTNDGTISVGRAFSILVTNAVSNWTTPQGLLGTFAELNAVNLTVTASHPLQTPTITLQSGSLPGGLNLTDNGNGTASISGTLNTLRSFDTTTTFTLRASSTTDTGDRTFSIIETSIDPVIGTFPVTAITVCYSESYLITATQSDGTIPSLTLRDQLPFNTAAGLYKISAGNWSGVSQPFAGGNFTPSSAGEPSQIERNFTFTDNTDGTATLTIAPQGFITSALGENLIGANNNSQTVLFNNAQTRVNELTDSDDTLSRAIRFVIRASTPQGVADQIFEVPLHKAPFINSGAVKVTTAPHFNMYDVGNA